MSLLIIALAAIVYGLTALAFYIWERRLPQFTALLLGFAYTSHFLLTEQKIGRPSIRIYVICLLLLLALHRLTVDSVARTRISRVSPLFLFSALLYSWIMFTSLYHDLGVQSLSAWGFKFSTNFLVPQIYLLTAIVFLRRPEDIRFLVFVCVGTVALSAAVAYLQYFGVDSALAFRETLYPGGFARYRSDPNINVDLMPVSGLSQYSIPYSYIAITFAPFALTYALFHWDVSRIRSIAAAGVYFFVSASLFVCRSRSGLLAVAFSVLLAALLLPRLYQDIGVRRSIQIVVIILVIFGVSAVFMLGLSDYEVAYTDFSRMKDYSDSNRLEYAKEAWSSIWKHPVLGISTAEFEQITGNPPHNALLNAGVFHGLPGVFMLLVGYGILLRMYFGLGRGRRGSIVSWVVAGTVLGVVNYTWNGWTHNSSLVSGGALLFMLLGIGISAWFLEEEQNQRLHRPIRMASWP